MPIFWNPLGTGLATEALPRYDGAHDAARFGSLVTLPAASHAMLHPDFPVVEGRYQMTRDWAVTLPQQFNRRVEDESLVFWRPGITAWTAVWGNDSAETQQERLESLRGDASPDAFEIESATDGDITRYSYRLTERRYDGIVHALYAFAIGVDGHVQMAIYCDDERDIETARAICGSLDETHAA